MGPLETITTPRYSHVPLHETQAPLSGLDTQPSASSSLSVTGGQAADTRSSKTGIMWDAVPQKAYWGYQVPREAEKSVIGLMGPQS